METKPVNGAANRVWPRIWSGLVQPLLVAACLFLWLVLTPTGQLIDAIVWWKALTPQQVNVICAGVSIAAAVLYVWLNRRSAKSNG